MAPECILNVNDLLHGDEASTSEVRVHAPSSSLSCAHDLHSSLSYLTLLEFKKQHHPSPNRGPSSRNDWPELAGAGQIADYEYERVHRLLRDLTARPMINPGLVITDDAPVLIAAVEEVFPASLRQRSLAHKMLNLEACVQPISADDQHC